MALHDLGGNSPLPDPFANVKKLSVGIPAEVEFRNRNTLIVRCALPSGADFKINHTNLFPVAPQHAIDLRKTRHQVVTVFKYHKEYLYKNCRVCSDVRMTPRGWLRAQSSKECGFMNFGFFDFRSPLFGVVDPKCVVARDPEQGKRAQGRHGT